MGNHDQEFVDQIVYSGYQLRVRPTLTQKQAELMIRVLNAAMQNGTVVEQIGKPQDLQAFKRGLAVLNTKFWDVTMKQAMKEVGVEMGIAKPGQFRRSAKEI